MVHRGPRSGPASVPPRPFNCSSIIKFDLFGPDLDQGRASPRSINHMNGIARLRGSHESQESGYAVMMMDVLKF